MTIPYGKARLYAIGVVLAVVPASQGCKKSTGSSGSPAAAAAGPETSPDPTTGLPPATPGAVDLTTNAEVQGQVAASALDGVAGAAATGIAAAGNLALSTSLALLAPAAVPVQTQKGGALAQNCYLGTDVQQSRLDGLTWPESSDPTSIFSHSEDDPADTTSSQMYVEPSLLQYPLTSPTTTLTLQVPFAFQNLVEVVEKDSRQFDIQLGDRGSTDYDMTAGDETHRFWVAVNAPANQAVSALTCGANAAGAAKGSSGDADGSWVQIAWGDAMQPNGLEMLERFTGSVSTSLNYLPEKGGVYATTAVSYDTQTGATGVRLAQYAVGSTSGATVPGATTILIKTVTANYNRVDRIVDGSGNVKSDASALDEIRPTTPLQVVEYRDSSANVLREVVQSGSLLKTASASGSTGWFTKFDFNDVTFDLKDSTEPCIPTSGSMVMTTFDKENGNQLKQITITYSSTSNAAAGAGKVDPQVSLSGDDANKTQMQWLLLNVDRRCGLKT